MQPQRHAGPIARRQVHPRHGDQLLHRTGHLGHRVQVHPHDLGRGDLGVVPRRDLDWPLSRPVLATLAICNCLNVWNKLPAAARADPEQRHRGAALLALFVVMRRQVMTSLGGVVAR